MPSTSWLNVDWQAVEAIATVGALIAAGIAVWYTWRQLQEAKNTTKAQNEQLKEARLTTETQNTRLQLYIFQNLMNELREKSARDNRRIVYFRYRINDDDPKQILAQVETDIRTADVDEGYIKIRDAVEETIGCLDRVGFFLMKAPPELRQEAPMWLWTITSEMWTRLGGYVKFRQPGHKGYGIYFEQMANEANKHDSTITADSPSGG